MVLTPALRGLFGLDWDGPNHTLRIAPNLPAGWRKAKLHNVPLGNARVDLEFTHGFNDLVVTATPTGQAFCLVPQSAPRDQPCGGLPAMPQSLSLPLPAVEVGIPAKLPLPGSRTSQLKVVGERRGPNQFELDFVAPGGTEHQLPVRLNPPPPPNVQVVQVQGATLSGATLHLTFPTGAGYQSAQVIFSW